MDTGKTILAFIAGAAVGAVTALMLTSDSGAKLREKIKEEMDTLKSALEEE